jgi:hypothetical protein
MQASWGVCLGRARGAAGVTTRLLPGTQNEHDGVTFDEHEQQVVGVHADAMVFTLTAGRLMSCSW